MYFEQVDAAAVYGHCRRGGKMDATHGEEFETFKFALGPAGIGLEE